MSGRYGDVVVILIVSIQLFMVHIYFGHSFNPLLTVFQFVDLFYLAVDSFNSVVNSLYTAFDSLFSVVDSFYI